MTENISDAINDAFRKCPDGGKRVWLTRAKRRQEIDFILNAPDAFWLWLAQVKWCSHLNIELDGDSKASMPLWHCRYCGALLMDRSLLDNHASFLDLPVLCRPRRWGKPIPFALFADIFVRSRLLPGVRGNVQGMLPLAPHYPLSDALAAIRQGDSSLALKIIRKFWVKEKTFRRDHSEEIQKAFKESKADWAVHEYGFYCEGAYSGFETGIERDGAFSRWLYETVAPDDPETLLLRGDIVSNVVGVAHLAPKRALNLHAPFENEQIVLKREPENPHDPNAIVVMRPRIGRLGYLKRSLAAWLAPLVDRGICIEAGVFARNYLPDEPDASIYLKLKGKYPDKSDSEGAVPSSGQIHPVHAISQNRLSRAIRQLDKARYHICLARERLKEKEHEWERVDTVNRVRAALNRAREAWLFKFAVIPNVFSDKDILHSTFLKIAPPELLRKSTLLDDRLAFLKEGFPFSPSLFDGEEGNDDGWETEAIACVDDIGHLVDYVEKENPLPSFHQESPYAYRPGQWVLTLGEYPYNGRYVVEREKIISLDKGKIVLRHPVRQTIHDVPPGTLKIQPTNLPDDDVRTPLEQRRIWFDLHPEFRQIPLAIIAHRNYGSSLYFTCPCCGYPTMTTHPAFNPKFCPEDSDFYDDFDDGRDDDSEEDGNKSAEGNGDGVREATIAMDENDAGGEAECAPLARGCYEICPLCDWAAADDAVDGPDIDRKFPDDRNLGYSLREARLHFESGRCIFTPKDGGHYAYQRDEKTLLLKEQICAVFDSMPGESGQGRLYLLWSEAQSLRNRLITHLQTRLTQADPETFLQQSRAEGSGEGRNLDNKWSFASWPALPGQWGQDILGDQSKVVWIGKSATGYQGKIRTGVGTIRDVTLPCFLTRREEKPDEETLRPFHIRRSWFEEHPADLPGFFCCPCCGCPTLASRGDNEKCVLCAWQDDGRDDYEADEIREGANGNCSLREARDNFEKDGAIHRPSKGNQKQGVPSDPDGSTNDQTEKKRSLIDLCERLIIAATEEERAGIRSQLLEKYRECSGPSGSS